MSLATSCPSCGTVFKVVEDQLKISEGWVRCGHCHDVFNALEGLFDLDRRDSTMQELRTLPGALEVRPLPREASAPESASALDPAGPVLLPTRPAASTPEVPKQEQAQPSPPAASDRPDSTAPAAPPVTPPRPLTAAVTAPPEVPPKAPERAAEPSRAPAPIDDEEEVEDTLLFDDQASPDRNDQARPGPSLSSPAPTEATTSVRVGQPPSAEDPLDPTLAALSFAEATEAEEDLPAFVKEARREARWSSGPVRAALSLTALILAGALAAQVTLHHRDRLHAACPSCRAPVAWLAKLADMPIGPPIVVEAVEVDNAVLVQPPGVDGYRLTVQVRNRAEHVVASPHMELSLTDATGSLLIRRVLSPTEFGQPEQLSGGDEKSWTLEFHSTDKRVAGYTVAAFYP